MGVHTGIVLSMCEEVSVVDDYWDHSVVRKISTSSIQCPYWELSKCPGRRGGEALVLE